MSPYTILGVASNCDRAVAEKAFRKLAMKHHPDRGGNEERFKQVKLAWEQIESGYRDPVGGASGFQQSSFTRNSRPRQQWDKPKAPAGTWRDEDAWAREREKASETVDDILNEMKAANRNAPNYRQPQASDEIVANVSMREAFSGFSMIIPNHHRREGLMTNSTVHIPPGMPNGFRQKYQTSAGDMKTITTRFSTGDFHLRGFSDQDNLFSAGLNIGDMELEVDVHALDIVMGGWIQTKDFLGETLSVRIPAGFNPLHRLKIAGKGYYGWDSLAGKPLMRRQDMYLRLRPQYTKLEDVEIDKVIRLYKAVQAMVPKDEG